MTITVTVPLGIAAAAGLILAALALFWIGR